MKLGSSKKYNSKSLAKYACLFCVLTILISYPFALHLDSTTNVTIYGVPVGYFIMTLLGPLVILSLIIWSTNIANDVDRHSPETENE